MREKKCNFKRLGVIEDYAQRDRQTDTQRDITSTRLNQCLESLSEPLTILWQKSITTQEIHFILNMAYKIL